MSKTLETINSPSGSKRRSYPVSHMVIYRGVDGKPGYHQTDDIHDAVGFVEQMRNEDGVEQARIFRLEEVVFEYRPYYRVELSDSLAQPSLENSETATLQAGDASGEVVEAQEAEDEDEDKEGEKVGAAKRGLFGR